MGIYIFNTEMLLKALIADAEDPDSKHDFGHNILPNMLGKKKMMAYTFVDENKQQALYWRDVGTLDAYYDANMDLCSVSPVFNLYDKSWPIRTRVRQYPPAKFVFGEPGRTGMAVNSVITAGVIISGASVSNSRPVAGRPRQLLLRRRRQHHLFPREHRPPLPHPPRHHRPRRPHPRRHSHRLRPRRRQAPLLRHALRPHNRHPRRLALRKPRGPRIPRTLLNLSAAAITSAWVPRRRCQRRSFLGLSRHNGCRT